MDLKMGYLGPEGTFSEEAARLIAGSNRRALQRYDNISDVIEAVQTGKVDEGIVRWKIPWKADSKHHSGSAGRS